MTEPVRDIAPAIRRTLSEMVDHLVEHADQVDGWVAQLESSRRTGWVLAFDGEGAERAEVNGEVVWGLLQAPEMALTRHRLRDLGLAGDDVRWALGIGDEPSWRHSGPGQHERVTE